jgi:DNA-binding MarR family transcriptional regulator
MTLQDVPTTLLEQDRSFSHTRELVAKVLLEYAGDNTTERRQPTQRDIAGLVGTDWETVQASLKSLQDEGLIRLEHLRVVINKKLFQKVAGVAGRIKGEGG